MYIKIFFYNYYYSQGTQDLYRVKLLIRHIQFISIYTDKIPDKKEYLVIIWEFLVIIWDIFVSSALKHMMRPLI